MKRIYKFFKLKLEHYQMIMINSLNNLQNLLHLKLIAISKIILLNKIKITKQYREIFKKKRKQPLIHNLNLLVPIVLITIKKKVEKNLQIKTAVMIKIQVPIQIQVQAHIQIQIKMIAYMREKIVYVIKNKFKL